MSAFKGTLACAGASIPFVVDNSVHTHTHTHTLHKGTVRCSHNKRRLHFFFPKPSCRPCLWPNEGRLRVIQAENCLIRAYNIVINRGEEDGETGGGGGKEGGGERGGVPTVRHP